MASPNDPCDGNPIDPQSLLSMSPDEFLEKYESYSRDEALVIYRALSDGIARLLCDRDDVEDFRKYVRLIATINGNETAATLKFYSSNLNRFLQSSNFIILCCKYNRTEILRYILHDVEPEYALAFTADDKDEEFHNAFYYAIRAGNEEIIDMLMSRWLRNKMPEKRYLVFAEAYEEFKLKNISLSDESISTAESRLVDFQFYANNLDINEVRICHEEIEERMQWLIENIRLFIAVFSYWTCFDDKFFLQARCIVFNINILKKHMRSTYNRIPWEEIEFYLIIFVNATLSINRQKVVIYKYFLGKNTVFDYLKIFVEKLEIETENIRNISVNNLSKFPSSKRITTISKLIQSKPEFQELYKNYDQIRDTYSLQFINQYLDLSLSVDANTSEGQLVISRTLLSIAELIKNNWESPNMSACTRQLLLTSLPLRTRTIIVNLHNSSSSYAQLRKLENESQENSQFFTHTQDDFKIINPIIKGILQSTLIHYTEIILESIVVFPTSIGLRDYLKSLELDFLLDWFEEYELNEKNSYEELLQTLESMMLEKNELEFITHTLKPKYELTAFNVKERFKNNSYLLKVKQICSHLEEDDLNEDKIRKLRYYARRALNHKFAADVINQNRSLITLALHDIAHNVCVLLSTNEYHKVMVMINKTFIQMGYGLQNLDWLEKLQNTIYRYKYLPGSKLNDSLNYRQEQKESLKKLNEEYLAKLHAMRILIDADELDRNIIKNQNKKFQVVVEMLVLDIMSILDKSDRLVDNHLMLDQPAPILVGKNLLNHLANFTALADIQLYDPSTALYLNAKILMSENIIEGNRKIGKVMTHTYEKLKTNFNQNLINATFQEEMYRSIFNGDLEKLKYYLAKGADIYARDYHNWTCLHYAAQGSSCDILEFILDRNANIDAKDIDGNHPLHIAAKYGRTEIVKSLIEKNVTIVDLLNSYHDTPLHIAVSGGYKEIVEILIQNDSDTSIMNLSGYTPVHLAAINGYEEILKMLLAKENKNIDDYKLPNDETLLHLAVEYGHSELVKYLISLNADVNSLSEENQVPLHNAAVNRYLEVVKILISNQANVNAATADGFTPLHYAVQSGNEEVVEMILDHGAEVSSICGVDGYFAIHIAAMIRTHTIVESLLKRGCSANAVTKKNMTCLHIAASENDLKLVKILLNSDANVNVKDFNGCTPLHFAAYKADSEMIEFLIEKGALVNDIDGNEEAAIHVAANAGNIKTVKLLVDHGTNLDVFLNAEGFNLLHLTSRRGHAELVQFFTEKYTNAHSRIKNSSSALMVAASSGSEEVVKVLINAGADVNAKNDEGYSALLLSSINGHIKIVQLLISANADVNVKAPSDMTPLHFAAEGNQLQIATLLLKNNCSVNTTDKLERSPLVISCLRNFPEMAQLLIEHGADLNFGSINPLQKAVVCGNKDVVDVLINRANINVNETLSDGKTLLHQAVECGHNDIVESLIAKKADVNALYQKKTPLIVAASEGYTDIVRTLLKNKADPDILDNTCQSALEYAAAKGHVSIVNILLRHSKVVIDHQNSFGFTLLHHAVICDRPDLVESLLKQRVDPNIFFPTGRTALHIAAESGFERIVKILLNYGAAYNYCDKMGKTPRKSTENDAILKILKATSYLFNSVKRNYIPECKHYIREGAVVNAVDKELATPLEYASRNDFAEMAKVLLENGASPNVKSKNGTTPLHDAARLGNFKFVISLLTYGAIHNAKTEEGQRPVDLATESNVTNILLAVKVSFDEVEKRNVSIVDKLLEIQDYDIMNAVLSACNQNNETLSIVAKKSCFPKAQWDQVNLHKRILLLKATHDMLT